MPEDNSDDQKLKNQNAADMGYHLKESEIMAGTADFRDGAFAFVTEGTIALRELGNYDVTAPIPNGESAITALIGGPVFKKTYGATSGKRAHLFYYDPSPAADHVVDIGVLAEEAECRILMNDRSRLIYGIVNPGGRFFRYSPHGEFSVLWKYQVNEIEFFEVSLGEEAACAALEPESRKIFALGRESSVLYELDIEKRSLRGVREIESAGKANAIVLDGRGHIFGSAKNGHFFRYSISPESLEILDLQLPSPKGMEFLNSLDSAVCDEKSMIYGGTALGTVFRLDAVTFQLIGFGRPLPDHRIRALVFGQDGVVYGAAGSPEKNCHLFRWNPRTGEVKDLGIPMVHFPKNWVCYDISALAAGRNGEIYIGESERVSYLLIYYPPA